MRRRGPPGRARQERRHIRFDGFGRRSRARRAGRRAGVRNTPPSWPSTQRARASMMATRAIMLVTEARFGGGKLSDPRTCWISAVSTPRAGALTWTARASTSNNTGMSSSQPRRSSNHTETTTRQVVSASTSATKYHATASKIVRNDETEVFLMSVSSTSLYDNDISNYN